MARFFPGPVTSWLARACHVRSQDTEKKLLSTNHHHVRRMLPREREHVCERDRFFLCRAAGGGVEGEQTWQHMMTGMDVCAGMTPGDIHSGTARVCVRACACTMDDDAAEHGHARWRTYAPYAWDWPALPHGSNVTQHRRGGGFGWPRTQGLLLLLQARWFVERWRLGASDRKGLFFLRVCFLHLHEMRYGSRRRMHGQGSKGMHTGPDAERGTDIGVHTRYREVERPTLTAEALVHASTACYCTLDLALLSRLLPPSPWR